MMGLMAAMDQIKERMGTISEIQNSKTIPDFQKTALVGEQAFMGVMDALDQTFGGIPGMIGSALGLSKEDLSNFYFDVQAGFSKFFSALGIGWDNFVDQLKIGWQSFKWTIMDSWEMIKASAGVVWAYIKKGWTSVTTSVGSLFDSFVTGIKEGFYKARDGIEVAITALTEMFMNLAVKLSAIVPEPMVKAAEKWLLDFKKTGGMQGLMIKQNQERLTREKEFQAREDKRKQEKAESDKAVADAEKELVSAKATMAAHQIISVVKSAGRTQKMMKDTATEWNQIEKEKDETKKTADKLRKDAEKRRKRRERQDKQEMKEEDKAAAEKAKVPTAAEQAAAKRRAMLPERFQNMDTSSLDPFMRDTAVVTGIADAVARAAIDKYTGPIDVRVSVEAKGDLKAAAKASKRKGGVTKRRVQ